MNGAGRASGQAGIALTTERTKGGIGAPAYHARSSGRVIEYPASAFDIENVHLKFTRGALHAIAREALKRKSGARGLRAIMGGGARAARDSLTRTGSAVVSEVTEKLVEG